VKHSILPEHFTHLIRAGSSSWVRVFAIVADPFVGLLLGALVFAAFFIPGLVITATETSAEGVVNTVGKELCGPAGMVSIPSGEFTMGTDDVRSFPNERPAHRVRVKAFWMDEHDVTNAQFSTWPECSSNLFRSPG
jgi:formylglycine-generating enzyme